jgi:hypothetical protein
VALRVRVLPAETLDVLSARVVTVGAGVITRVAGVAALGLKLGSPW